MNITKQQRYHATRKATLIGAAANIALAIAKVLFGWLGHSNALVADGIHSFSDLLTDVLVIFAAKFAHHEADEDHPYGHERIETAATVGLAIFLIIVGLFIIYEPVQQLINHRHYHAPETYVLWIAILSVIVNEIIYRYTLAVAKRIKSDMLHANALHSRSDAASSLVVLIGVGGSLLGFGWLDEVAAIIVGLMIVKMGIGIGWRNISELIDTGVDEVSLAKIKDCITTVPGVEALHQLRTRKMAGKVLLDVHVIVNNKISVSEGHHIGDQVLTALYKNIEHVCDVTVHVDSEDDELYSENAKLPNRGQLLSKLKPLLLGMAGAEQIQNIRIHYVAGKIELDICLPLSVLQQDNDAKGLTQRYQSALAALPEIKIIKLFFA
jgi:cation diffusion facilitator family transporter